MDIDVKVSERLQWELFYGRRVDLWECQMLFSVVWRCDGGFCVYIYTYTVAKCRRVRW